MRFGPAWEFFKRQPKSFWFVNLYLFFEYVRPQQIYEAIEGPPWVKFAIVLAVAAFLMEGKPIRLGLPEGVLLAFTVIVFASSATALVPEISFSAIWDYLAWVVIYFLIANTVNTEGRFIVFMYAYLIWNFKMSNSAARSWAIDGFRFRGWGANGAPGWFSNSGEFGIQMCLFLAVAVPFWNSMRKHWSKWVKLLFLAMGGTAVLGIVASSSRGSLLGLAGLGAWLLITSRHKWRALLVAIAFSGLVWVIIPPEQKARLSAMGEDKTSNTREVYWERGRQVIDLYPVLGIGFKNWPSYHKRIFGYEALPHNIFIECAAELGVVGLAGFIALIGTTLVVNLRTRRKVRDRGEDARFFIEMTHGLDGAMIAFLVAGTFVTVLYYPFFWINFAMTAALSHSADSLGPAAPRAPLPPQPVRRSLAAHRAA